MFSRTPAETGLLITVEHPKLQLRMMLCGVSA